MVQKYESNSVIYLQFMLEKKLLGDTVPVAHDLTVFARFLQRKHYLTYICFCHHTVPYLVMAMSRS